MTKITYKRYPRAKLAIDGHCNAPRTNGYDLCCAAVSMLACTFMQRMEDMPLKDKFVYCEEGYVHGEFSARGKKGRAGLEMLDTLLTGFRLLKDEYPDCIMITGGKK